MIWLKYIHISPTKLGILLIHGTCDYDHLTQPVAAHLRPQGCNLRIDSGIFSVPRLGRAGTLHCLAVEGITYDQLGCAEIGLHQHPKYMSQKAHMV